MRNTLSVRLNKELATWLEQTAARSGLSQGQIVREQLEKARAGSPHKGFLQLAGTVREARDLSRRKGFSRP